MSAVGSPGGGGGHAKSKGKKHKRKKVSFSLDMTPMVDVAFLLLTFFMLTTTFSKPTTMEINLPPDKVDVPIAVSNILTVRVVEGGKFYYNVGDAATNAPQLTSLEESKFRKVIESEGAKNDKLVVVIKLDKKAKYRNLVDIIDELNLAKMNRFAIAPFLPEDTEIISKALSVAPGAVTQP